MLIVMRPSTPVSASRPLPGRAALDVGWKGALAAGESCSAPIAEVASGTTEESGRDTASAVPRALLCAGVVSVLCACPGAEAAAGRACAALPDTALGVLVVAPPLPVAAPPVDEHEAPPALIPSTPTSHMFTGTVSGTD